MERVLEAAVAAEKSFLRSADTLGMLEECCAALIGNRGFESAFSFLIGENGESGIASVHPMNRRLLRKLQKGDYPDHAARALEEPGVVFGGGWMGCRLEARGVVLGGLFVKCVEAAPGVGEVIAGLASDLAFAVERCRNRERHRETETLLAAVFQNAPALMLIVDRNGSVFQVNGCACDFAGRSASEMTGLPVGEAIGCLRSTDDPRGCGNGPFCPECPVSSTLLDTLTTGKAHRQVEIKLPFRYQGAETELTLLLSTTPLGISGERMVLVTLLDVTDRRKAHTDLMEAHASLQTVMEITNTRLDIIDGDFNLVHVDPGWMRILGDPEGRRCYSYFMDRDTPCESCAIPQALQTGETRIAEHTLLLDGNRQVEVHTIPIKDSLGRPLVAEFNIDITRRRMVEEELKRSEKHLRSIFLSTPIGIGIVRDGIFQDVNPKLCDMTGYSREELVGNSARCLNSAEELFNRAETTETRFTRRNGDVMDVLLSSTPLDPDDPSGHLTFTALDITETRRAAEALRESEEYQKAVFQSINDGVFVDDADTMEIIDLNDTVTRMYGYTREEVVQRRIAGMSSCEPPYDMEHAVKHLEKARLEGPQVFEWQARNKAGETFWVEVNARFAEIAGKPRFIVTVRDISERKAAEREKRKLERQVHQTQKLESLGVLAGGIAHDFNNILMVILGNAQLAISSLPSGSRVHENLADIEVAAQRASELCRQMLSYSGRATFVRESVDLGSLVREMVHLLKTAISKKARFQLESSPVLPLVTGDPAQLRQVVMNLIINASESLENRPGTVALTVGAERVEADAFEGFQFIEAASPGLYVTLEVADDGCGMDEESRSRVFEPFFSTKFTGRGLGLVAVLGIIRSHGGGIRFDSSPGRGTVVKVIFPVGGTVPEADSEAGQPYPEQKWRGKGTLLLADDEENIRTVGTRMLEKLGFDVVTAADGLDAVKLYREREGEIRGVLLDLTMPRMDGLEAFDELRRLNSSVKVVLFSGFSNEDVDPGFKGKGLAGFLQKPFTLESLRELLCRVFP